MPTTKFRDVINQLPYLPRALALVWAASRGWTVFWAALLILQGLLPVAVVYLTRSLVDSLVAIQGAGIESAGLRTALVLAGLMAGIMLLMDLLRSAATWIRAAQAELVQEHIITLIHRKSIAVDLAFYEQPDYYDRLYRAQAESAYRPVMLLESIGSVAQSGVTLLAMSAVLIPYGIWLWFALLLSSLPALYVVLEHGRRQHQWRKQTTADERRTWYYNWLLTTGEAAAELRLFGLGEHFQSAYRTLRRRLRDQRVRLARNQGLAELAASAFALVIIGGVMIWMIGRVFQGQATLGDLALFYQAFNQGQRLMRTLMENVGQVYSSILFLGNLFDFLALEPRVVNPPQPSALPARLKEGIHFRDVKFRYPGSQRLALQGLNLSIPAGQVVALVGANGAGKTTLVKLLCRLYDPDAGRVELGGVDLRDLRLEDIRRRITVLCQEPVHYNALVRANILLGDVDHAPDAAKMEAAAHNAGAAELITQLPKQYDTLLGKWFEEGTELSVGEWQRIALARAFLREAEIILLDEPTSAMDPWAEATWLGRFREIVSNKTVILITHRLTTAMRADVIYVMENGRIAESGTHLELLARGGRYAESWNSRGPNRDEFVKPDAAFYFATSMPPKF